MKKNLFTGIIRDEPADAYHAKTDYIGSSSLAEMSKTPMHFLEAWQGKNVESTPAMDRGSFMHKLLLELSLDGFAARLKENGRLVASNTSKYKEHVESLPPGTIMIDPDLYNDANDILSAALQNKNFVRFANNADSEVSVYGQDKATGLYIKCRHDLLAKDHSFTLDVKTTNEGIAAFERQIFKMGYDVRQAHYKEVNQSVTGKNPKGYFFVIEQKPPYANKMYRLSVGQEISAQDQWRQWMNVVSVCEKDGKYPGYSDEIFEVERPQYISDNSKVEFKDVV